MTPLQTLKQKLSAAELSKGRLADARKVRSDCAARILEAFGVTAWKKADIVCCEAFNAHFTAESELSEATRNALPDLLALVQAAQGVTWYDWSGNDSDAVAHMDRLRAALSRLTTTPHKDA